jgi:2-polyprenyl-3-methyl-5-hydroxy-6-metoxy-1,4-benzoquinol methylase
MNCKICHSPNTTRIHHHAPGGPWWHCFECNSSSSEEVYNPDLYTNYLEVYRLQTGVNFDESRNQQTTNVGYFTRYKHLCPNLDFLDVGHCDGAALANMQDEGYAVHGFDVVPCCDMGPHTTIAPEFKASLFPRQYGAIQCREVIEHVPDFHTFLDELILALSPKGIIQIQTPRPWHTYANVYIMGHLQIPSHLELQHAIVKRKCRIVTTLVWDAGQLVVAQKS